MTPETRPPCQHCRDRAAKKGRDFCSGCYKRGIRMNLRPHPCRPDALVDTGLRIDDEFAELVHPDGTRQFPVPPMLVFTHWIEPLTPGSNMLRVLRPAATMVTSPTKERA